MANTGGKYWYKKHKLKPVMGFLKASRKKILKEIAEEADYNSLTRYVSRLLERHIDEKRPLK